MANRRLKCRLLLASALLPCPSRRNQRQNIRKVKIRPHLRGIACEAVALVMEGRREALARASRFFTALVFDNTQVGLVLSAISVGTLLTPPLVAWITIHYGWRASFLAIGTLGLLLVPPWLLFSQRISRLARRATRHQPKRKSLSLVPWLKMTFRFPRFFKHASTGVC